MDVLSIIVVIFIVILLIIFACLPAMAMIWGLAWASKICAPRRSRWIRWGAIVGILLIIPQVLNLLIDREIKTLVAQSHGQVSKNISTKILAVQDNSGNSRTLIRCGRDCALLLLSGKIDQYLIVHSRSDSAALKATAFKFEKDTDCSFMDEFVGKNLTSRVENSIRELSLTGICLTSTETTPDMADTLVKFDKVKISSWMKPSSKGYQQTVSYKNPSSGEWVEQYRNVSVRYGSVFPLLLPIFKLEKNGISVGVMRQTALRTKTGKRFCPEDWFSDFERCHRQLRRRSASSILGLEVSESSLEASGMISKKHGRTIILNNLVKTIIAEDRNPNPNEWALIERYISSEYDESDAFAELVIKVISNDNFPIPGFHFGIDKFSHAEKTVLTSAVMRRILSDTPGPEIGDFTEKQQWHNLYNVIGKMPANILDPHFDDLVSAVSKRPYHRKYVDFLKKFGLKSGQPIIDILKADRKRLKSLSPVMCTLGSELSSVKDPLMKMAESHHIRLDGNYGHLVYLLMDLGVDEDRMLNTVDPSFSNPSQYRESIERSIGKYKAGKSRCRRY